MNTEEQQAEHTAAVSDYKINVDMWKHYDNLRQNKNNTFLTANSILAAVVGFVVGDLAAGSDRTLIALLIAIIGFLSCLLWFLLLSRNGIYIKFHRSRIRSLESEQEDQLPTLSSEWDEYKNRVHFWEGISSNSLDRLLSAFVAVFWFSLAIYFLSSLS